LFPSNLLATNFLRQPPIEFQRHQRLVRDTDQQRPYGRLQARVIEGFQGSSPFTRLPPSQVADVR
jgi:hypothetical protein